MYKAPAPHTDTQIHRPPQHTHTTRLADGESEKIRKDREGKVRDREMGQGRDYDDRV